MKIITVLLALLLPGVALAQSNPGLQFGQVPTAAQWNSYFAGKMDYNGTPPCLLSGCTATGPFVTSSYVQTGTTVVGSLPTCNAGLEGARYYVTDASSISYRTAVTGGGSTRGAVLCSNSAWLGD